MSEVSVSIAGRDYRLACDDGQEEHLQSLGAMIDTKISDMRKHFGEIGDMRLAVMATIVIADELSEAKKKIAALDEKIARLQNADAKAVAESEQQVEQAVDVVENLAERLETLAADLRNRTKDKPA